MSMGAGDVVTGGLRRALKGVKGVLPGPPDEAPAAEVAVGDAEPEPLPAPEVNAEVGADAKPTKPRGATKSTSTNQAATKKAATKKAATKKAAGAKAPADEALATKAPAAKAPAEGAPAGGSTPDHPPAQEEPSAALPTPEPVMPTWSPEELAGFRAALDTEVARLREELDMGEADLAGLIADSGDGAGDDQADAGSKTFEREHEMSVNANTREMLDQALRALRRLEAGTYGMCESCGRPIAVGRLKAYPRATLCISCKQAEERR
jgi:RNA polymerase-binding protein DksA